MFYKKDNTPYKTPLEGVHFKSLVYGTNTSLHEFKLDKGSKIPMHSHPHEQTGYLVSGKMNFLFKDKTILTELGDSWSIPGGEEHGVDVIEDCVVIEIFSPVREEYLH
ncbi:MAG: cupin [Ignavibacteria bacterium RBG_13_36_8]|nr:MAG: cupin [Ignavibacteria bacterium RBG_13_36_8]